MRIRNTETLPDEKNVDAIREICSLMAAIDDPQLLYEFFGCLFTAAELKDFANRWHLVKELDAGTTQREIARKYGMSLCNITRGSREMKKEDSAFKKVLEILKNNPSLAGCQLKNVDSESDSGSNSSSNSNSNSIEQS